MRVTIQTTCDLEEIPEKISEILEGALCAMHKNVGEQIRDVKAQLKFAKTSSDIVEVFEKVKNIKSKTADLDISLDDVLSILHGYVQITTKLEAEAAAAKLEELQPTVDEIVEQIETAEQAEITDESN